MSLTNTVDTTLHIFGIPKQSVEDTVEIVLKQVNDIGVALDSSDTDRSHYVGKVTDRRHNSVHVL